MKTPLLNSLLVLLVMVLISGCSNIKHDSWTYSYRESIFKDRKIAQIQIQSTEKGNLYVEVSFEGDGHIDEEWLSPSLVIGKNLETAENVIIERNDKRGYSNWEEVAPKNCKGVLKKDYDWGHKR